MNISWKSIDEVEAPWEPVELSGQEWSPRLAAHLFRRASFGASIVEIDQAVDAGLQSTLDRLFDLAKATEFDEEMLVAGRVLASGEDSRGLAAWWLLRMAKSPCPLLEKMTLFWHGHFATGAEKVINSRAMLAQNKLLRQHALGRFEDLVQGISKDPAMLIYLDSTENRKTRPNENYARELLELFCLGPGNYTEADIKEIARCFTGWEVKRSAFRFNRHQYDSRIKSFFGESGNLGGEEAVRIVLNHRAAPDFIARKMIRFFVFDSAAISDQLVKPISEHLRESDFDIAGTLRKILSSRIFFSPVAVAQKIKSPVELAIGALRFFDAQTDFQQITQRLERLGQLPFYPPNVKGWDGGTSWINASTIIGRANLVTAMLDSSKTKFDGGNLKSWFRRNRPVLRKDNFQGLADYLFAGPINRGAVEMLESVSGNARDFFAMIASLPEFQLS